MATLLVTGSSGLIGAEVCSYFAGLGYSVHGLDNNQRPSSSGPRATRGGTSGGSSGSCRGSSITSSTSAIGRGCWLWWRRCGPAAIVHTAAQPSHDRAAAIPFDDFDTNAVGTLNLLEAARRHCPESPFVHMSTNKVYGDRPNTIALREAADPLGLRRPGVRGGHPRDVPDRPEPAQPLRRLQGGGRRDGAGVRALLRDADLLPARRLPDRAQPQRGRAARLPELPGEVQPGGAGVPGLRLQGQAGPRQHPQPGRGPLHPRVRREPAGRARSTTSAAARATPAASSRPSGWWRS